METLKRVVVVVALLQIASSSVFAGTETSIDIVATTQTNANMGAWTALAIEDSNWNEAFNLANYLDPGYPKHVTFGTHKMPGQWAGGNGMFVDASLTKSNRSDRAKLSGIAWQMQGESSGAIAYTQNDGPSGLDAILFQARLAQTIRFDDFSVWNGDGSSETNNYTIVVPALLSSSDSGTSVDFAPGASMSVVACYRTNVGCYELRVERNSTDGLQMSIYKWSSNGSEIRSELLATHWFRDAKFTNNSCATKPNLYAIVLSVSTQDAGVTTVMGGLSTGAYAPSDTYSTRSGTTRSYNLVCGIDNSSTRHTKGAYGVLPTNCNGVFLHPRQYSSPLPNSLITTGKDFAATKAVTFAGTYDSLTCRGRLIDAWTYTPARAESYTNTAYGLAPFALGIRALSGRTQTVDVYLKPRGTDSWPAEPFERKTVSNYVFMQHTVTV